MHSRGIYNFNSLAVSYYHALLQLVSVRGMQFMIAILCLIITIIMILSGHVN